MASAGGNRSSDHGDVPWPALVDLLTSVLITFMFFVLVTTVAMSTMTVKTAMEAAKRKEAESAPQDGSNTSDLVSATMVMSPVSSSTITSATQTSSAAAGGAEALLPPLRKTETLAPPSQLITENENLKEENKKLKEQLSALTTSFSKSTEIKTRAEPSQKALMLMFRKNEAGMLPEAQAAIARFVEDNRSTLTSTQMELTASQPDGVNFSQSREQALTRGMVVRNVLLEMKVNPSNIRIRFDDEAIDDSHDWVRLRLIPQQQPTERAAP